MRKYLRYANLLALGAGAVGMLLAFWLFSAGTDEKGLYPANHIGWILLGIWTLAAAVVFWLLSRQAGINRAFAQNFPASLPGALGYAAAAIGMLSGSIGMLKSGSIMDMAAGAISLVGSIGLLWASLCRFQGRRCKLLVHMLPCFFFTIRLFALGQAYGAEPEMCRFVYCFAATVTVVPACYWLWSFDVNMGNRPNCIFWCLAAGYFNLVAAVNCDLALLHLTTAVWLLTALPKLGYLPKQLKAAAPAEAPAATQAPEFTDPDAILEELLRDFGQQEAN